MDTVSRKLAAVGERKSDWEFMIELGQKLGYGEYFPSLAQLADDALRPMGITWEELKQREYIRIPIEYRKYEKTGFGTPTGKFEIFSTVMKDWGYDPLPAHVEPEESPLSMPDRHKDYPLLLVTGVKQPMYYHSQGRQIPSLRHLAPEPLLEMHSSAAAQFRIAAGEFAWVETVRGRLRLKVRTNDRMHPKIVSVPHGWWLPEQRGPDHAVFNVCANVLTDDDPENCDPAFGGSPLKGLLCRVYRADEQDSLDSKSIPREEGHHETT
jgi:anaerobic selenocysteine-containing dehydrogenase